MTNGDAQHVEVDCVDEYELMTIDKIINGKVRYGSRRHSAILFVSSPIYINVKLIPISGFCHSMYFKPYLY